MSDTILAQEQEKNNFLIPNGTFFAMLVIFLIVLGVLARYVYPPLRQALADRHDRVQRQLDEAERAKKRFAEADQRYKEALSEARNESSKIRDDARVEGNRIVEELREQADAEVARVRQQGEQQLAQQRERVVTELRDSIGELSSTLASRVAGADVGGVPSQERVDRFLAERGEQQGDSGVKEGSR